MIAGYHLKSLYQAGKVGDATKEISMEGKYSTNYGTNITKIWFNKNAHILTDTRPFAVRGGDYGNSEVNLYTCIMYSDGNEGSMTGFRAVLCYK